MSDTPRTDEAEANALISGIPLSMVCRQLERELAVALEKLAESEVRNLRLNRLERELEEMKEFRDSETRWAAQYKRERDKAEQSAAKLSVELGRALSERDGLRYQLKRGEETAARMLEKTIQERDEAIKGREEARFELSSVQGAFEDTTDKLEEARECLLEAITAHVEGYGWGDKDAQRWRRAAGLDHIPDATKMEGEQ